MQETPIRFLGWEDPLRRERQTLQCSGLEKSMGLQRVGHHWVTFTFRHLPAPEPTMVLVAGRQTMVFTWGPCSPRAGGYVSLKVRNQWRSCTAL